MVEIIDNMLMNTLIKWCRHSKKDTLKDLG